MTLSEGLILWGGSFGMVFLLGFQSRAAIAGLYPICFVSSFCITGFNLIFVRGAVDLDPWVFLLVSGTGSGAGICAAIWVSKRVIAWHDRRTIFRSSQVDR